jgi:hypothetical protein
MRTCDYCGRVNEDAAMTCYECGSSGFAARSDSELAAESRKLDPDEIPLAAIAVKDGSAMTLRCRTPGEAYLICDELEKADILSILPEEEELLSRFRNNGHVEVRVSAKAYQSLVDLKSTVEFQYKRLRAEQPLPHFGKLVAIGCAMMLVPGVLMFAWLLTSYRKNGYDRKARDFKFWFFLGVAAWLLLLAACVAFSSAGTGQRAGKERANESPEPTGAALRVSEGRERFAVHWFHRSALSGASGSAPRWASTCV